jgi:hypothetical protein
MNPYGFKYFTDIIRPFEDHPWAPPYTFVGQVSQRMPLYTDMMPLRWAEADEDVEMWVENTDADADGLPDWWEDAYGLDPTDPTGDYGADGDLDRDGLSNSAELLAGTRPNEADTDGDGFNDFYSWSDSVYRVYGEIYTDHDNMEDVWEGQNGLDPRSDDASGDADDDGWSNYAEFMAQTDPQDPASYPTPQITFHMRYDGLNDIGELRIEAYRRAQMDGQPDAVFSSQNLGLVRVFGEVLGGSGLAAYAGFLNSTNITPGSLTIRDATHSFTDDGTGVLVGTLPGSSGTINYITGAWSLTYVGAIPPAGNVLVAGYTFQGSAPDYPGDFVFTATQTGYVREGDNWFFAFIDLDGSGTWETGEPFGVSEYPAHEVGWFDTEVTIGLTDYLPGYGRFLWPPVAGADSYDITIRNLSLAGGPIVLQRNILAPRAFFHEGDYRLAGFNGLAQAGYQWFVKANVLGASQNVASNVFTIAYASPLATPTNTYPLGATLTYARNTFRFMLSRDATQFRLQIARDAGFGNVVFDTTAIPPYRWPDGVCRYTLPILAGDAAFTNGVYYWRVMAINPTAASGYSTTRSFTVNLADHPQGPHSIAGDVFYVGKVTNGASMFVVQASRSPDFNGLPEAQVTVKNQPNAVDWPMNDFGFALRGLPAGVYYVRGFLDQNANRKLDAWESRGAVKDDPYYPLDMPIPLSRTGEDLFVMMLDTDNDRIADDWEYQYFGNLTTAGPGALRGYTDSNSDGINDYESYALSPLNLSPIGLDQFGADGIPYRVKNALGLNPLADLYVQVDSIGEDAEGQVVVTWRATPVGVKSGSAAGLAMVQGDGVTLSVQLQGSDDLVQWSDVGGGVPVTYDGVLDLFRFTTPVLTNDHRFYRFRVSW